MVGMKALGLAVEVDLHAALPNFHGSSIESNLSRFNVVEHHSRPQRVPMPKDPMGPGSRTAGQAGRSGGHAGGRMGGSVGRAVGAAGSVGRAGRVAGRMNN
jgi:hypothetical protein